MLVSPTHLTSKFHFSQDFCFKSHILGDADQVQYHFRKWTIQIPRSYVTWPSIQFVNSKAGTFYPLTLLSHLPHPWHQIYLDIRAQDPVSENFYYSLASIFIFPSSEVQKECPLKPNS